MLQTVDVGSFSIESYRHTSPDWILDELQQQARELHGIRVLHVNATPYGGGVSELLRSTIPLCNDLGLIADWKIISGDDDFFDVTKHIHNGLQGSDLALTEDQEDVYRQHSRENAERLEEQYDVVVIHDPQPAGLLSLRGKGEAKWIWRCHIDTSEPNPYVWAFLQPFLEDYDAGIFTMSDFVPPSLPIERVELVPPAIDPLSPKNLPLDEPMARQILRWIGVTFNGPLVTQISRFDPWKDPLGVIEAYRLAREEIPDLQLALAGSMALDDPEGWEIYQEVQAASETDPFIHVFTNLTGVGNIEVNAFQRLSDVVVQKSIREGFGLVVSEALWKATPVVAGRAGGIPLQMADGAGGYLIDSVEECAERIVDLLSDRERAAELARQGQERVRERFLLPRLLLNELALISDLLAGEGRPLAERWEHADRDPVCGMVIGEDQSALTAEHAGRTYRFCSQACRARFLQQPERFIVVHEDVEWNGK